MEYIPASHEDQKIPQVWKKVLIQREDLMSGQIQMINWAKLPVGNTFQAHFHESMEEVFIVLSGNAKIKVGMAEEELIRGDVVIIPPKTIHKMSNSGDEDVEYIVIGITKIVGGKTVTTKKV